MKVKNGIAITLTCLSTLNIAHAITIQEAAIIAQEEAAAAAEAAEAAAAAAAAEQDIINGISALDDINSIFKTDISISGSVTSNDSGALASLLTSQPASDYGILSFSSDGSYTYTLNRDAPAVVALEAGEYLNDLFSYQIIGEKGYGDVAVLTIQILGKTAESGALDENFYAFNDENSIVKSTVEVTGDVSSNDSGGTTFSLVSNPTSTYGSLIFLSDGTYTYRLNNSASEIVDLKEGDSLTDAFIYQMEAFGKSVTANIIIRIIGADNAVDESFYALNDENNIIKNSTEIVGSVSGNDVGGLSYSLTSNAVSSYGALLFSSDGGYTYRLNNSATAVQNLQLGDLLSDTFTYTMQGLDQTTTADLTIRIIGKTGSLTDEEDAAAAAAAAAEEAAREEELKAFYVLNDFMTIVKTDNDATTPSVTGTVLSNDGNVESVFLNSSPNGLYGNLTFTDDGAFTYTLNTNTNAVQQLGSNGYLDDTFSYTAQSVSASTGEVFSDTAILTIRVLSETWSITQNVEIEPNDLSSNSTPVNSGQLIRGHLQEGLDRDIYQLNSLGNEVIRIELCPQGEICAEADAWVLMVFDGDTYPLVELSLYPLLTYVTDGTTASSTGQNTVSTELSSHMYLNYWAGAYASSMIGIIDPCHGEANTVDIGVGNGAKTYYVAITNQLQNCDGGEIVQEQAGPNVLGPDPSDPTQEISKATTEQFIVIAPMNSDQYSIQISSTGVNPLQSTRTLASTYNPATKVLLVPEIQIDGSSYAAELELKDNDNRRNGNLNFGLLNLAKIEEELKNNTPATYDPVSHRVKIPKYVDDFGVAYSVDLLFHPAKDGQDAYLELIKLDVIE